MLSSDVSFGSVVNGLEMSKLSMVRSCYRNAGEECGTKRGVEKRHQLKKVRNYLALGIWVGRVDRGSGRNKKSSRFLHLFLFSS